MPAVQPRVPNTGIPNALFDGLGPLAWPGVAAEEISDTVTVSIQVTEVDNLYSTSFDLTYSPTVLKFYRGLEGSLLSGGTADTTLFNSRVVDEEEGQVVVGITRRKDVSSLGVNVDEATTLCSLEFEAIGVENTMVNLSSVSLLNGDGMRIFISSTNGTVTVQ